MLEKIKHRYKKKLETDFLPEALEIVEKPASPLGHFAIDEYLKSADGKEAIITSGMSGTAEIKLEDRQIIEFFLEPIFEYFDNSLKLR